MPHPSRCPDDEITRYTCYHTPQPLTIDGRLDEAAWQKAPKSRRFVDTVTGAPGFYDTHMAALWDKDYLYVGFWAEEPFLDARHTERDAIIFQENDLEIFIDGGDCYYELEFNALATIYEVMFIWRDAYTKGSRFDIPEFDLLERESYSFGGDYDRTPSSFWRGTHPRGTRWAFTDWDFPGLQVAVHLDGTLNDHSDRDRGWTAEVALPWSGMSVLANGRSLPPKDGDTWRMFFGRFQKLINAGREISPHPAWVLSPHGEYDTHRPECFPYVTFAHADVMDIPVGSDTER